MTATRTRQQDSLPAVKARNLVELAALVGANAIRLQAVARTLHRLGEQGCNGFQDASGNWDQAAEERADRREDRLLREADDIAARHGYRVYYQGDPRGWPLYLWRQADLDAWNERRGEYPDRPDGGRLGIDSCYNAVGVAVCPH